MTDAKNFIDRTGRTIQLAGGRVAMACDDPYNPTKLSIDLCNPKENSEFYFAEKFRECTELKSQIKFHALLFLSGASIGYDSVHFYYSDKNSILAAEFGKCSPKFLQITDSLGMVNGVPFKKRISSNERNSYIFLF
ncbi:MAG: hypothetical protein K2J23_02975 [Muribaculaceae bacterium]|nr:hypothetical protein [Muribaculaceae bacterium]